MGTVSYIRQTLNPVVLARLANINASHWELNRLMGVRLTLVTEQQLANARMRLIHKNTNWLKRKLWDNKKIKACEELIAHFEIVKRVNERSIFDLKFKLTLMIDEYNNYFAVRGVDKVKPLDIVVLK